MAAEKAPAFQFYPKDFLSDGKQIAMTLAEVGAYWRLCCHCWMDGSLPVDIALLARRCGASKRQMQAMWPAISPCFVELDGVLVHKRLELERDKQAIFRRRQSDRGKASAAAKANRQSTKPQPEVNHGSTKVQRDAQPNLNSPISHLQTAVSTETHTPRAREAPALAGMLPRDHLRHAWCSSRGKCVPEFLHGEFVKAVGGDEHAANQRLKVWYEAVEAGWPAGAIGDDPVKLWRKEFASKFPSVAPSALGSSGKASTVGKRALVPSHEPL